MCREIGTIEQGCCFLLPNFVGSQHPCSAWIWQRQNLLRTGFDGEKINSTCVELSKKLSGIDFKRSTLLIGKKAVQGIQPALISKQVTRSCENNGLIYSSKVNGNYEASGVHLFTVIGPKFSGDVRSRYSKRSISIAITVYLSVSSSISFRKSGSLPRLSTSS